MPQYNDTLATMVSRVLQVKPNASQTEVVRQINGRIRQVINSRLYWSDLLTTRIISFPNQYTGANDVGGAGVVAYTFGSATVTGTNTTWPVSDVVNTNSGTSTVVDSGYTQITPASMAGIKVDTLLYVDATGNAETVAVVQVTATSFFAKFAFTHSTAAFTITSSSFAGLQLYAGTTFPTFTIISVQSTTSLTLDQPWGGPSISAQTYSIIKAYVVIDPNLKLILDCVDQKVGRQLEIYVPVEKVNLTDPQRSQNNSDPLGIVQHSASLSGSMRYEIWPAPTVSRQLWVLIGLNWPELVALSDRPPWFIDPNLFVTGAIADALRIKNIKSVIDIDPHWNPDLAMQFEQMFRIQLNDVVNADEAKAQRAYTHEWQNILAAGGANYWQMHDPDLATWSL